MNDFFNYTPERHPENLYAFVVWGKLIKRELAINSLFDTKLNYAEDVNYISRIFMNSDVVFHSDYCGYYYCLNDGSAVSKSKNIRKIKELSSLNSCEVLVLTYINLLNSGIEINQIHNLAEFYAERIVMILRTISFYDKDYLKQNKKILKELANLSRPYLKGNRLKYVGLFIKHDKLFYAANKTLKLFWGLYYKIKN